MTEFLCPYCDASILDVDMNHAGINEDSLIEQRCSSCSQWFILKVEKSIDLIPRKADCLNGHSCTVCGCEFGEEQS